MKIMFGNTNFGFVAGILAASVDQDQAVTYAASQRYVLVDMDTAPEGVKEAKDKGNGKFGLSKITEEAYIALDLAFADAGVDVTEGVVLNPNEPTAADIEAMVELAAEISGVVSGEASKGSITMVEIPMPRKQAKANRSEYDADFRRGDVVNIILHGQGPHQKPKEGPFLCLGNTYGHMAYVKLDNGKPTGEQLVTSKLKAIPGQKIIGQMVENWTAITA